MALFGLFGNNEDDQKETAREFDKGLSSIRDLIAPSAMEVDSDHLKLNDLYVKTLFVLSYPQYVETNWLSPIINSDITMDVSLQVHPVETKKIMKILQRKVKEMEASVRINQEKGAVRDPELEQALQNAEELRDKLQAGTEKFFRLGLYFTIYAKDKETLDDIANQIESTLGGKLLYTKQALLQMPEGLNSTLPQATDELEVVRNMTSSSLAATFPFNSFDLTSDDGVLYGVNRHNQSLILFDRFELENANSVVLGKSGGGKSYAVKLEILRSMMMGTDVFVIDPENEYELLSKAVGGTYIDISLNSDKRINPFDLPNLGEDVEGEKVLRAAVVTVAGLVKQMIGDMTAEESSILDKAIYETYAARNITEDSETHDNKPPTMDDLQEVLSNMEGGDQMAIELEKYTTGTFSGIFNKRTNVDLDRGMVVFNIRDLEDQLRPYAMYLILDFIWSRIRNDIRKRMLVVDEAWIMMQHEDSAKFLYSIAKRARKYFLGLTTITQDVEDFLDSRYGRAIVANSSMQLILRQSPSSIDLVDETFNLTQGERFLLLQAEVGNGLFFAGSAHAAIEIVSSFVEDRLASSDPEDLEQIRSELG